MSCVEWLSDAKLASFCECVEAPLTGLAAYAVEGSFKLYLEDVGMLCSLYGMLAKRQILDGSLAGSMKGGVYENLIAGYKLTGGNVGVAGKKVTLPHYMAMFILPPTE